MVGIYCFFVLIAFILSCIFCIVKYMWEGEITVLDLIYCIFFSATGWVGILAAIFILLIVGFNYILDTWGDHVIIGKK